SNTFSLRRRESRLLAGVGRVVTPLHLAGGGFAPLVLRLGARVEVAVGRLVAAGAVADGAGLRGRRLIVRGPALMLCHVGLLRSYNGLLVSVANRRPDGSRSAPPGG